MEIKMKVKHVAKIIVATAHIASIHSCTQIAQLYSLRAPMSTSVVSIFHSIL